MFRNNDPRLKIRFKKFLGITGIFGLVIIAYWIKDASQDTKFILCLLSIVPLVIFWSWVDGSSTFQKEYLRLKGLLTECCAFTALLFYSLGQDVDVRICFAWIGFFGYYLYNLYQDQYKEIVNIKHNILTQEEALSYRLDVEISLNWEGLLQKIFKDEQLIKELIAEENLQYSKNINKANKGLLDTADSFRFTKFYYSKMRIPLIWSNYHKNFQREMMVVDRLFAEGEALERKLCEISDRITTTGHLLQPLCYITPYDVRLNLARGAFYHPFLNDEEVLSKIPFSKVIDLLLEIGKNEPDYGMKAIRKFPASLQAELDKWNVKYSPSLPVHAYEDSGEDLEMHSEKLKDWAHKKGLILSKHTADSHVFEAECFSVYINIECMMAPSVHTQI